MIEHRPRSALDAHDHGWLQAVHHLAFAGVGNPLHRPMGALKVWNDDTVAPGAGFPMHGHQDIEIVTYVREGAITHEDTLGNRGRTEAGEVQVMRAGTGIRHSEFNAETVPTRLFQIWLATRAKGSTPIWAQRAFPRSERANRFVALASGRGIEGALPIEADADVWGAALHAGDTVTFDLDPGTSAYFVSTVGRVEIHRLTISPGDGVAVRGETSIAITAGQDTEVVLVHVL